MRLTVAPAWPAVATGRRACRSPWPGRQRPSRRSRPALPGCGRGHGGGQDELLGVGHRRRRGLERDGLGAQRRRGRRLGRSAAGQPPSTSATTASRAEQSGHPSSVASAARRPPPKPEDSLAGWRSGRLGPWRSARTTRPRWPGSSSPTSTSRSSTAPVRPRATWSPISTRSTSGCSPSCGTGRCRSCAPGSARRRSCRRTCRSTPPTGSAPRRSGPTRRSARCATRSATTGGPWCGWPTSGPWSTTQP